jgi:hypothetical protein
MKNYNYATAYWKNEHIEYEKDYKLYTNTLIYLLNPNDRRAYVEVSFYDLQGVEYLDMRFGVDEELLVPQFGVYDMRVVDMIPDFTKKSELRQGWIKLKSSMPLVITAKIEKGSIIKENIDVKSVWSIPFTEYPVIIDEPNPPVEYKKPDGSKWTLPSNKKVPPPRPL